MHKPEILFYDDSIHKIKLYLKLSEGYDAASNQSYDNKSIDRTLSHICMIILPVAVNVFQNLGTPFHFSLPKS